MDRDQEQLMTDLMNKVGDDVSDAISRTISLVSPEWMLPLTNRAMLTATASSAMIYDIANRIDDPEKMPTQEMMALAALVSFHNIVKADHPWDAAIADLKKHFPNAKIPPVNIIDRRKRKLAS